ncbi:melatonin receptor type 1B-like [Montipora capricornis]|uniref:melatonin receptor type 1B-like n=1 Tax=Montipora capricornis TaxID=246305 RepID=UPI0035F1C87B
MLVFWHKMAQNIISFIEAAILVIICAVSIIGNTAFFVIFLRSKTMRTISNGYLLNLAFADLLVSVLNMPVTVVTIIQQRWIFGESACKFLGFTTMVSFVSSVMSLAMIAINRYYYVVHWKTYRSIFTPRKSVLFGGIVWLISLLLSLPPLLGWADYRYIPGQSYCFVFWPSSVYYLYFMFTICFLGPPFVMSLSYYRILRFTREAKRKIKQHRNTNESEHYTKRRGGHIRMTPEEVKITYTLLIVVACFMISWTPFVITMFMLVYYPHPLPRAIHFGTLFLGYASCMLNPFVYGIRNEAFKTELVRQFRACFMARSRNHTVPVNICIEQLPS